MSFTAINQHATAMLYSPQQLIHCYSTTKKLDCFATKHSL